MDLLTSKTKNDLATYYAHRYDMRTGDCLLWKSKSLLGAAIRIWSKGFNHASLIVQPHAEGPFCKRRMILEALDKGIILRLISERLQGFKGEVWHYPLKDGTTGDQRRKIEEWAEEKIGTPYDFDNLFKNMLGHVSADATALFCSEYYFMAVKAGRLVEGDVAPRPGDIPKLEIFKDPVRIL